MPSSPGLSHVGRFQQQRDAAPKPHNGIDGSLRLARGTSEQGSNPPAVRSVFHDNMNELPSRASRAPGPDLYRVKGVIHCEYNNVSSIHPRTRPLFESEVVTVESAD